MATHYEIISTDIEKGLMLIQGARRIYLYEDITQLFVLLNKNDIEKKYEGTPFVYKYWCTDLSPVNWYDLNIIPVRI